MSLVTRLTAAMVGLVLLTAMAMGLLIYRNVAVLALPLALDRIDTRARVESIRLEDSVVGARADLAGFRASNAVYSIMEARLNRGNDPASGAAEAEWKRTLALRLTAELKAKPNYYEFRYIGIEDGGRELVRVDRSGPDSAVRLVEDAELQRFGEEDFFKKTIGLPDGELYISPIDLLREHDARALAAHLVFDEAGEL